MATLYLRFAGLVSRLVLLSALYANAAMAQVSASDADLLATMKAIVPRIVGLARSGPEQISKLRMDPAPSSFFVNWQMDGDTAALYLESSINFVGALQTRIIEESRLIDNYKGYYWSVILARESNVSSVYEGRIPELYRKLAEVLDKMYPRLTKTQSSITPQSRKSTLRIYHTLAEPTKYCIGIEAWYDKVGRRNTIRLYINAF